MTFRDKVEEFSSIRKRKFLALDENGEDIKAVKVLSFVNHYIPTAFFVFTIVSSIFFPAIAPTAFLPIALSGVYTYFQLYDAVKNLGTKVVGVHPFFSKLAKVEILLANIVVAPVRLLTKGGLFVADKTSNFIKKIKEKRAEKKNTKTLKLIEDKSVTKQQVKKSKEETIELGNINTEQLVDELLGEQEKKKKFSTKKVLNHSKKQEEVYDIQEKEETMSL